MADFASAYTPFNRDALALLTASYDDEFESISGELLEQILDEAANFPDDTVPEPGKPMVAAVNLFESMLFIAKILIEELAEAKNMSRKELVQNLARWITVAPNVRSIVSPVSNTRDRDVLVALMNCYMKLMEDLYARGMRIPLKLLDSYIHAKALYTGEYRVNGPVEWYNSRTDYSAPWAELLGRREAGR